MVVINKVRRKKEQRPPEDFFLNCCDARGIVKLDLELMINKGNLNQLYRMDKGAPFATGLYAEVKRCRSLREIASQQKIYAAKFSQRRRPGQSTEEDCCLENLHEIALLSQLKHPHVVAFQDAFILEQHIVTIMELAPGGDLQSIIDADLVLLEKDAARYIYQLLDALKYLHARHIAHLDIKPQNLLLMGEFPGCNIKLCDFEISRITKPGQEIRELLGTPDYVAPEILLYEPLTTFADIWSVGILTYVLVTGFSPFGGDTDQETYRNIVNEPVDYPEELFEDVSAAAIDFINKLTAKNANSRPTAAEMQDHDWLKAANSKNNSVDSENEEVTERTQPQGATSNPKKRTPKKAMASGGCSTASIIPSDRRSSARSILRACKSAYDLTKMGGKTKSREALMEKLKMSMGASSGSRRTIKNLSKSREQLWESKLKLSKSCEKISYFNLPGSSRWASIANLPSLDANAGKMSTSQESVVSLRSNSTNPMQQPVNSPQSGDEKCLEFFEDPVQPVILPTLSSTSVPNTPPVPNFDLTSPKLNSEPINPSAIFNQLIPKLNILSESQATEYPPLSIPVITTTEDPTAPEKEEPIDPQKSVAELIVTFGGRSAAAQAAANKKIDFKNVFDPIFEVEGSEDQPISFSDGSDNNSSSGVSSEASLTLASASSFQPEDNRTIIPDPPTRRGTRAYHRMKEENRRNSNPRYAVGEIPFSYPSRRGSATARNNSNGTNTPATSGVTQSAGNLKGILKSNKNAIYNNAHDPFKRNNSVSSQSQPKNGNNNNTNYKSTNGARRSSGNNICNKSTISSAAKVVTPKNMSAEDKNKKFQETKLENLDIVIPKTIRRPRLSCKADSRPASFIFVNLDTTSSSNKKKSKSTPIKSGNSGKNVIKKNGSQEKIKTPASGAVEDSNNSKSVAPEKNLVSVAKVEEKAKSNEEISTVKSSEVEINKPNGKQKTPVYDRLCRNERTKSFNENHRKIGSNTYHGRRSFEKEQAKLKDAYNGRPPWNFVCTGSVGRAKQKLVTGCKNPRRSSIPDF